MSTDYDDLRKKAEAATEGPCHWAGNTDTGEPYLATWIPGAGRCQVLSIGSEERTSTGRKAAEIRDYAEESGMDPDDAVQDWMHDSFGNVMTDPRLQFTTDLMCADARKLVVYEVAPEATSREDKRVYRADVVGIRHPDAEYLVAANPQTVLALLDEIARLRADLKAVTS